MNIDRQARQKGKEGTRKGNYCQQVWDDLLTNRWNPSCFPSIILACVQETLFLEDDRLPALSVNNNPFYVTQGKDM